jgi:hypothetical protein
MLMIVEKWITCSDGGDTKYIVGVWANQSPLS